MRDTIGIIVGVLGISFALAFFGRQEPTHAAVVVPTPALRSVDVKRVSHGTLPAHQLAPTPTVRPTEAPTPAPAIVVVYVSAPAAAPTLAPPVVEPTPELQTIVLQADDEMSPALLREAMDR